MAQNKGKSFWKNFKEEFRRIIWPTREQVTKKTMVVIFVSVVLAILILGFDTVYKFITAKFI